MPVLEEDKKYEKKSKPVKEEVNHPERYAGSCSIECIEVMEVVCGYEAVGYFCLLNAFKYLWRYKHKNGQEDLDKAGWYLDWIEHKKGQNYDFEKEFLVTYARVKDLYITIWDKIANDIE